MAKQVSKTVIGGFVISAIALLVIGIVIIGGGKFFTKTEKYVFFFDRSVKGLNVGAPVVFRGVEIGSVKSVVILADTEKFKVEIPVVIEIEPHLFRANGEHKLPENPYDRAKVLIDRGIRAKLTKESYVTGQLMVEVDFYPDAPVLLKGIDVGYPELPTMPSGFDELTQTLKKVPVEEILGKLVSALENVEKVLSAPELMDTVRNLNAATDNANALILNAGHVVDKADKLLLHVDRQIDPLSTGLQAAVGDVRKLLQDVNREVEPLSTKAQDTLISAEGVLDQATRTLKIYEGLVDERSELRHDLSSTLNEIAQAARSIRAFTDYLEQHPEALIQGKGGH